MRLITFISLTLLSSFLFAKSNMYYYKPAGIAFDYSNLTINSASSRNNEPISIIFETGKGPFSIAIFFKAIRGKSNLETFIKKEKEKEKKGNYQQQVTIKKIKTKKIAAYEIFRDAGSTKIHWFVFQTKKNKKLYAFYFVESPSLKEENNQALVSYKKMKSSLTLSK